MPSEWAPAWWRRTSPAERLVVATALAVALALKAHYSVAGAGDLRWILAPTAWLVGAVTGAAFVAEPAVGYTSTELHLVIAPVCAGVNFLIIAFCTGAFGLVPLIGPPRPATSEGASAPASTMRPSGGETRAKALFLAGWLGVAYLATVAVNALRLLVSLRLRDASIVGGTLLGGSSGPGLTAAELHRIEGVVVYLSALCALFLVGRTLILRGRGVERA